MKFLATYFFDCAHVWFNLYFGKATSLTVNSRNGSEKFDVWTGTPDMTIGPGKAYVRRFCPGGYDIFGLNEQAKKLYFVIRSKNIFSCNGVIFDQLFSHF